MINQIINYIKSNVVTVNRFWYYFLGLNFIVLSPLLVYWLYNIGYFGLVDTNITSMFSSFTNQNILISIFIITVLTELVVIYREIKSKQKKYINIYFIPHLVIFGFISLFLSTEIFTLFQEGNSMLLAIYSLIYFPVNFQIIYIVISYTLHDVLINN